VVNDACNFLLSNGLQKFFGEVLTSKCAFSVPVECGNWDCNCGGSVVEVWRFLIGFAGLLLRLTAIG